MELFQLRSFLRVTEEGSITRAAEALCLTQPAVTQQIRALERELGVALFDRTGRGMRLTPAGEALRQYTRRSVGLLEECRQVIADLDTGVTGRLLLGAGVTTSIFHLPAWLRAFQERFPRVDVVVRTGRSRETGALVLDREIDLGLITSPVQHPDLTVRPLYDEEIVLVAPTGHPLAGKELSAEDLARAPLILFQRGTGFRTYLDRTLGAHGVVLQVKMESDSAEAIKSFVTVGLGVAFLPAAAVQAEVESGLLSPVRLSAIPPLKRTTSAVYRPDRYLNAAARGFLAYLVSLHDLEGAGRPA